MAHNVGIAEVWVFVAMSARRCCLLKKVNFIENTKLSLRTKSVAKCAGELIFGQPDDK